MSDLRQLLAGRIALLDGAIGTELMCRLPSVPVEQLVYAPLTHPAAVADVHRQYAAAGADVVSAATFMAPALGASEAEAVCRRGVELAKEAAAAAGRQVFVVGCMGAVGRSAGDYRRAALTMLEAGADAVMLETATSLPEALAAVEAIRSALDAFPGEAELLVSASPAADGHLPDGTSMAEFAAAVEAWAPLCVGLNCSSGPSAMKEPLRLLDQAHRGYLSLHPNAGMPAADGTYRLGPDLWAEQTVEALKDTRVRLVGGCCGTTPAHISALKQAIADITA